MNVTGELKVEAAVTFRQYLGPVLQQQLERIARNRIEKRYLSSGVGKSLWINDRVINSRYCYSARKFNGLVPEYSKAGCSAKGKCLGRPAYTSWLPITANLP